MPRKDYPDGEYVENHKNGKPYIRASYKNGRRDGLFQMYNGEGRLAEETYYTEGLRNGIQKYYTNIGQERTILESMCNYMNGKKHGEFVKYYNNGTLLIKTNYMNGSQHGPFQKWNIKGKLVESRMYTNGISLYDITQPTPTQKVNPTVEQTNELVIEPNSGSNRNNRRKRVNIVKREPNSGSNNNRRKRVNIVKKETVVNDCNEEKSSE